MPINWVAVAISVALAAGSAYTSARAASITQKNVRRAIISGLDEQEAIDKKQADVVRALLPEVDQKAQDQFLSEKDLKNEASLAKTSKQNQASRQTDIAIAGKITKFKGERAKTKSAAEVKYNARRFALARYLAPNAVALFLDPKLNESASELRELGTQKRAEANIANIKAEEAAAKGAPGLDALATVLSIGSAVAGGFAYTAPAEAGKQVVTETTKQAAAQGGLSATQLAAIKSITAPSGAIYSAPPGLDAAGRLAAFSQASTPIFSSAPPVVPAVSNITGTGTAVLQQAQKAFAPENVYQGDVATWSLDNSSGITRMPSHWQPQPQKRLTPFYNPPYSQF